MKLKGIRTIALLLVAILLVIGSAAAMAAAGAEDRGGDREWGMDDSYWWEVWWGEEAPLTPYQREQIGRITDLILDRYFGIEGSFVMTPGQFDKATSPLVGQEWEGLRLFGYYAQKRGFEVPAGVFDVPSGFETPPGIPPPTRISPDVYTPEPEPYWWEIVGDPEGEVEAIMKQVAEAKGMSPDEVRERFGELFPGVDLWSMTFGEFSDFLNSLPRPPLKLEPVCFEELKHYPYTIALWGRVPEFSTNQELHEFNQKLEEVLVDVVGPLLWQLCRSERPFGLAFVSEGAIKIGVRTDHLPNGKQDAKEMYQMIAKKAERLFGIEDVPVVFIKGMELVLQGSSSSPSSTGWEAPWNEPFCPIPGAVKVTPAGAPAAYSTASFAVRRFIWWRPWDWWDEDYIITGHKGPGLTITPVNMHINQPTPGHEAGRVKDNVGTHTYADAARVGISDARMRPYILIGGSPSRPALRPVFASGDPAVGDIIWISAGRTGLTFSVDVVRRQTFLNSGAYEELRDQVIVRPRVHLPGTTGGDSGSPCRPNRAVLPAKRGIHLGCSVVPSIRSDGRTVGVATIHHPHSCPGTSRALDELRGSGSDCEDIPIVGILSP
ncbi:hypothetical protein M1O17_01970 [Dehalococcoidia bacterium]|nr:hypothetical protein [Dehalococcoidia bacterium]